MAEDRQNSLAISENTNSDLINIEHNDGDFQQFVTFTIDQEEFGIDILSIREIKGWSETTTLPNTPEYVRGVLNLRGLIVPIFDLRNRFGGSRTEATSLHVVIIVHVGARFIGILVDAVSDILSVKTEDINPVPKMERNIGDDYLNGLVTVNERMVALLDTEKLFDREAIDQAHESGAEKN